MQPTADCARLFRTHLSPENPDLEIDAGAAMTAVGRATRWRRNQACDAVAAGGGVACIICGGVRKFALRPNGQRQIIDLLIVGDYLGLPPADPVFFLESVSNDTWIVSFTREQIEDLAARFPAVASLTHRCAGEAIRRLEHHLLVQSRMTAREKVGAYLAEMSRRVNCGGSKAIMLPITRYDIADHLGIAVETVSRTMTMLRRRGSITLRTPREVEICDSSLLSETAPLADVHVAAGASDPRTHHELSRGPGAASARRPPNAAALAPSPVSPSRQGVIVETFNRHPDPREQDPCASAAATARPFAAADDLRSEALGLTSAGLAHDLGNHLQVVASTVRMLERQTPLEDPSLQRCMVRSALTAIERATLLARRISAPAAPADDAEITSLNGVILNIIDAIVLVVGPSVAVEARLSPQAPLIFCDTRALENVILNLAINARDAMPGGGRLTLSTDLDASLAGEGLAFVRVEDTGLGMTEEVLRRAFEPLFTTKAAHGAGLGLAAVSDFVRRAGGSAKIETAPGVGTRVVLSLPACR